jgi:hypothetical protein
MQRRLLLSVLASLVALPLPGQAPRAGSLAVGVGFGFNTAGALGVEASLRYLATDRLALGCRVTTGWGLSRACGANIYPSELRDWHIVAELGHSGGEYLAAGIPMRRSAWFVNLGGGVEEKVENDQGGHYRDNRVHFVIGPSFVLAERVGELGEPAPIHWRLSPRVFNHTELLLYPILN